MSACEFSDLLEPYHDGELPAGRRAALEAHLGDCPTCPADLAALRRLSSDLSAAGRAELSEIALHRLHLRLRAAMDDGLLRFARALTAVAACLLLAGSVWLMRSGTPQASRPEPDWAKVAILPSADNPVVVAAAGDETLEQWIVDDLAGKGPVK